MEQLEDRRLLTVSQDIVSQLTPYQNALSNTLDIATSLPLVGDQLADLQAWNTVFEDSVTSLASRVDSLTNGRFELAIPLPSLSHTFTFDLGLDAFLQVQTSGGVSASINPVLNVAFDLTNGVPSLDPTHTGLDIGFVIGLPNFQLTASLNGKLYAQAVDDGTTFSGNLGFNFDTNFGIEANFSGDAHVRLGLSVSLVDPALNASFNPRFFTDLELDWGFDTQGDQLKVPVIAFRDFSLDADSFMQGFLGDTVKGVQKFTKPMQPFIDMFEQPVPIISSFDSSETMGDLFLQGAGLSEKQQDSFNTMVKIVKAVNTFDFSGTTGGAVINFGDILLTGDARLAGQFLFDTTQLQGVIDDIMNSPALQEVQEKLETVAEYVGFTADAGFKYPLLENPGQVIGSLLTGQTEVMFSYSTGRQHFELGASSGVGIPDLLGFFLNAGVVFDASLSVGYDTAGLRKFIEDAQPESLLHGFYIDNSGPPIPNVPNPRKTSLYLQGHADISASAVVTVSGGLYADIAFELASNSVSPHVYLDDIITSLSNNMKVFNPSGRLYAAANIELTVPTPVGPDITLFSHQLSYQELLSFNIPPAPTPTLPLTVIAVTDQHTLLLDVTKMTPGGTVKVQPFHDYPITADIGYLGDGIRVDYPSEIVMYVERKNDITTNYYNFVGLSGTVPDGVSIDIVDPFTVFTVEGAPDPQPPQTESGVLLAGGKNVVYKYTENAGGSLATVLLVGGYGSNSLAGGTMTFGNFVPADRMNQAKGHFGNVTGFDAAGQAYFNARLDSVLAPASPSGIIGATMTGNRGGLMFGGPGNNSFLATGPGAYEMLGGAWTNNFTISPSFNGVPATYEIDGGPFGKSTLVVRVPPTENVSFENSTVVDKYNSSFKALAVQANAGLSATAHGIKKVQIISQPGASVTIGDTSELNIEFAIVGGAELTFGGTNAPDSFSVTTTGPFFGLANHYSPARFYTNSEGNLVSFLEWGGVVFPLADPVYAVTRTFGTNGRTQTIPFAVRNASASSIRLNAGGASDTYAIDLGLGAFMDVTINDTDTATVNSLTVSTNDGNLQYRQLTFTDNSVLLDYYTAVPCQEVSIIGQPRVFVCVSSVHYTPKVTFGPNVSPTVRTRFPFANTTINRPVGPQAAQLVFGGGPYTTSFIPGFGSYYEYEGLGGLGGPGVLDLSTDPPTTIPWNEFSRGRVDVVANGGTMTVQNDFKRGLTNDKFTFEFTYNVLGNAGTLAFIETGVFFGYEINVHTLNVLANAGTINVDESIEITDYSDYAVVPSLQVNVGSNGTLANIHGTINLTTPKGIVGLKIDDRLNPGTAIPWLVESQKTTIGDLTINHDMVNLSDFLRSDLVSKYEAFPKPGSLFVFFGNPYRFYARNLNGAGIPDDYLDLSVGIQDRRRGETVSVQVTAYSEIPGTLTYGATGLPPGLSIDTTTGLITGTISAAATEASYTAKIHVSLDGTFGRGRNMTWNISSNSQIIPLGTGVVTITSPVGTEISASVSPQAGVALPAGVSFPFGFVDFVVQGLAPGQAADVIIAGLDLSGIEDYYKYGATPANATEHWYNFLFGQATDGDSAVGTGMEIVGGNIVLHLVDGGRGDDDTSMNGVIFDIGGPAITVTIVNQPPVITSNGGGDTASVNVLETTTAVTTAAANDPDAGATLAYSIVGGADASKFNINTTSGGLAFAMSPDFEVPTDADANNSYVVIVQVSDGSLSDTQLLTVTVTNANELPVITSSGGDSASVSVSENTSAVTTVVAADPDAGTTIVYNISGGADAAQFAIDPSSGALTFIGAPNFEAPADAGADNVYDVVVAASDGSLTDLQTIAVTVTNADEPPVITSNGGDASASVSVPENTTAVTTVAANDPDAGATLAYSISGGADAAQFAINSSSGALTFVTAPNFEAPNDADANNSYLVVVQVSDGSLTDSQSLTVTVTNADEPPVITSNGGGDSASVSVPENTTAVTTVTATDPDAGTTLVYSISGGADAAQFAINSSSGALTFVTAPNFEVPTDADADNVYDVVVAASDGSLIDTQVISVTVTDVAEAAYTISGKVYKDVTGNGESADDLPWTSGSPVTLNLYADVNGDGAYQSTDTLLTSTVTGSGGVYSFVVPVVGKYIIKEVVPNDFVRTFPVLSDYEAVNLNGAASSGNDWYNAPKYCVDIVTNLGFIVDHGGGLHHRFRFAREHARRRQRDSKLYRRNQRAIHACQLPRSRPNI